MCGIAGVCGAGPESRSLTESMLAALRRRGPDGEGVHVWPNATFGHRRLAIFDLSSAGDQPMLSPDASLGVVFNGAIYNFLDLRKDLERLGYTFSSRTDTEVLLHGFRAWGLDGLVKRLRGMFAFALWDNPNRTLHLVRDRLGVKPLFYALRDSTIAFASTAGALRAANLCGDISPQAVAEFLQFGFITDERCIYEGVSKIPPGSIATWSRGELSLRRYWTAPDDTGHRPIAFDDAVDRTEELLLESVRIRLHADVPVAALLSGGIDSTLVCWAIAKLGGDVTAFTVGTPNHHLDETNAAEAIARRLGIRHQVLSVSEADRIEIGDLASAFTEPFACSSALGLLRISERIAATPARVVLTGDGGDDVFLGYPRHRMLLRTQRAARMIPESFASAWRGIRKTVPRRGMFKRGMHLLDYTTGGLGGFLAANPGLEDFRRHDLLGPRMADTQSPIAGAEWSLGSARQSLSQYLAYDLKTQFSGEYLVKVDGAMMHFGLEARSPFLDHVMWEFAASLPYETRLHGGTLKAILRALARRHVGGGVDRAPKRGFSVPVEAWMGGRQQTQVARTFRESVLIDEGWVREPALRAELEEASASGHASRRLWYLWVLEEWLRHTPGHAQPAYTPTAPTALAGRSVER